MSNEFVFSKRIKSKDESIRTKMLNIAKDLNDVITLGRGDPDLDTAPHIIEHASKALLNGATHYTHPQGLEELRKAICDHLNEYHQLNYEKDEIVVTAGAQSAIFTSILALIDTDDEVIIPSPGYGSYDQAVEMANGKIIKLKLTEKNDFAIRAEELEKVITEKTKIFCLINPSNPTGAITPPEEIIKIAELLKEKNIIVISDEIYSRLPFNQQKIISFASIKNMKEKTITINGFSKAYSMTGWRIGYLATSKKLVKTLAEVHHGFNICAPAVSQHAAIAALTGPQEIVTEALSTYEKRKDIMCATLDKLSLTYGKPGGGFYIYANVSSCGMSATDFCIKLLKEQKLMIFPGILFGDYVDNYLRISLLQPENKIQEACNRLEKFVISIKK